MEDFEYNDYLIALEQYAIKFHQIPSNIIDQNILDLCIKNEHDLNINIFNHVHKKLLTKDNILAILYYFYSSGRFEIFSNIPKKYSSPFFKKMVSENYISDINIFPDKYKTKKNYIIAWNNFLDLPTKYQTYKIALEKVKRYPQNYLVIPKKYITYEMSLVLSVNFGTIEFVPEEHQTLEFFSKRLRSLENGMKTHPYLYTVYYNECKNNVRKMMLQEL